MSAHLHGRNVLITGASDGIGRAAAVAFVAKGANVWALARTADRLEALAAELGGPPSLVPLVGDVTDGRGMAKRTAGILEDLGVPDVIVANAGIGLDARFQHTTDDDVRRVFEVNVAGVYRTVRPFIDAMVARGSGRILLISSVVGKRGIPNYSAYSGSKFALHGMAGSMRTELWGTGVTVGLVCPSSTETDFRKHMRREGPRQGSFRVSRHSVASVANAIVRMAVSRRREIVLSPEGKLMAFLEKLAPGIVDRVLHRVVHRKDAQN